MYIHFRSECVGYLYSRYGFKLTFTAWFVLMLSNCITAYVDSKSSLMHELQQLFIFIIFIQQLKMLWLNFIGSLSLTVIFIILEFFASNSCNNLGAIVTSCKYLIVSAGHRDVRLSACTADCHLNHWVNGFRSLWTFIIF